jgi:putative colanic acid biosynthesis acetyltransferase WcaF
MLKTDLSKFNNSWYLPGSKLKIILWFLLSPLTINTYLPWPLFFKKVILNLFGAKIAKNVIIKPKVNIKYPWKLSIGQNTWIGEKVWIDNLDFVTIGANVCISQGAFLLTGNHNYRSDTFDLIIKPISLEDGVWIGARAIVCPGVVCFSHSILSVGSVTSKNLDAYSIYKGNPAIQVATR